MFVSTSDLINNRTVINLQRAALDRAIQLETAHHMCSHALVRACKRKRFVLQLRSILVTARLRVRQRIEAIAQKTKQKFVKT